MMVLSTDFLKNKIKIKSPILKGKERYLKKLKN
jgi:hypothetical protein